nr:TetR/AcrR family transcriptional regulator [Marinicella sp. W31]MDC2875561.1 TetR/AcrR family transcriptional regulator [Marinicella sp. W31]
MTRRPKKTDLENLSIWERPEPVSRPAPVALSRDMIVRAAVAIADEKGMDAVSLRSVGGAMKAVPMRLYRYIATKEELVDLMIDHVYGETHIGGPDSVDWRDALKAFAFRTREVALRHLWFAALLGGRRHHRGPNALAHFETALAALSKVRGFEDINIIVKAMRTVQAYVIGAIQHEVSEIRLGAETGLNKAEWQQANWSSAERMINSGRFPTLSRFVLEADDVPAETLFKTGLDCVLDGIEKGIGNPQDAD